MKYLGFALTLLVACDANNQKPAAPPAARVTCQAAQVAQLRDIHVLRGTVGTAPDDDVLVASQVAGRVQKILVREGDVVPEGATIATIESQPLSDALRVAQAQLNQATAVAQNANVTLKRSEHLLARGIAPRQQVDDARAHMDASMAAVAAAMAQMNAAESNLRRTHVVTSTDGVVLHVHRRDGELVDGTSATAIAEVADPNDLEFLATASPADLVALQPNQTGSVTFEALPGKSFRIEVGRIPPAVDPNTGVAVLRMKMHDQSVRPPLGLLGIARVATGEMREAVVVSPLALRVSWSGAAEVVVCEGGHARVQGVQVGQRDADYVEIKSGLKVHDKVVTDNVVGLSDGAAIAEAP